MRFCKLLFHILWLSLEINSVYDVAFWLTAYCIFEKKKKNQVTYAILCTGLVKILAMMYLCSNASVNRRKKEEKKTSGGTEKPSLKTFDDPDPLFPNY